jgi:putative transposase
MPRVPRFLLPDGIYHVTARGNRRQRIFRSAADGATFLDLLDEVVATWEWRLATYCLMPNHYHLVLQTTRKELTDGMHRLNMLHAMRFNRRYDVDGHVFQGRFGVKLVESESHLFEVAPYVVLNPVRAGLCRHPREWRWSSYRASVGSTPPPAFLDVDWLARVLDTQPGTGRGIFAALVEERLSEAAHPD